MPNRDLLTRLEGWRTLRRMNRIAGYLVVLLMICVCGFGAGGCVTAHEAKAKVKILDNTTKKPIDDCILLTIRQESTESQGHWWVAQEERGGHMTPTEARVQTINSGDLIDQKGKVMVTVGPYVKGHTLGVEYWVYRPGYQPDDFLSDHVERAYEDKTDLDINLLAEDAGSSLSDEKILDGARRVLEMEQFLEPCNPEVTRLLTMLIQQLQRVQNKAYKPKWQKQSKELLVKLQEMLQRFPRVEVTWKNLPEQPAEKPTPVAKTPPPAPVPVAKPTPVVAKAPVEPPPVKPTVKELQAEEQREPATSDLPIAAAEPADEPEDTPDETPSPQLEPVDLSALDDDPPVATTQPTQPQNEPADNAPAKDEDAVENELKPIRKNP